MWLCRRNGQARHAPAFQQGNQDEWAHPAAAILAVHDAGLFHSADLMKEACQVLISVRPRDALDHHLSADSTSQLCCGQTASEAGRSPAFW